MRGKLEKHSFSAFFMELNKQKDKKSTSIDSESKRKRGRPRKHPLPTSEEIIDIQNKTKQITQSISNQTNNVFNININNFNQKNQVNLCCYTFCFYDYSAKMLDFYNFFCMFSRQQTLRKLLHCNLPNKNLQI